jgi:hypothetical protein
MPNSRTRPIRHNERLPEELGTDFEPRIREKADAHAPRNTQNGDNDGDGPLIPVDAHNAECRRPVHRNQHLRRHHDDIHRNEIVVPMYTNEYVEFVIQASIVILVENLEPDKHVEDHGAHLVFWVWQELGAGEVHDEGGNDLEYGLADYHFPHCEGDDGGGAGCWRAVEDFRGWGVGGEGEGCKGVPSKPLA